MTSLKDNKFRTLFYGKQQFIKTIAFRIVLVSQLYFSMLHNNNSGSKIMAFEYLQDFQTFQMLTSCFSRLARIYKKHICIATILSQILTTSLPIIILIFFV